MDFEFTADQQDLRDVARNVLASACPTSMVRSVHEGTGPAAELWSTLCGLDWPGLAVAEAHGGLGLGFLEAVIVAEELGRVVAPTPYLATVTQYGAVLRAVGDGPRLGALAAGRVTGTLAVAEEGRWEPSAVRTAARRDGDRWVLAGTKSHVMDGATADEVAVVARGEGGLGIFAVPREQVVAHPLPTVDPTQPVATLELDGVAVGAGEVLVEPGDPAADDVVARVLDEGTAALCVSAVATCRRIFEATVDYAKDRRQFGRAIGSFQAVKHRLADCFLAVERASALAYFAALTVAEDDPRRSLAVSMAKSAAGDCQRLVARDGLQLHGGIGFTWEHDLHFWLKRAVAAELLFGTSAWHRTRVAELLGLSGTTAAEVVS